MLNLIKYRQEHILIDLDGERRRSNVVIAHLACQDGPLKELDVDFVG